MVPMQIFVYTIFNKSFLQFKSGKQTSLLRQFIQRTRLKELQIRSHFFAYINLKADFLSYHNKRWLFVFVFVCLFMFYLKFEDDNVDTSNTAVELIASLFKTETQKEIERKERKTKISKLLNLSLITFGTGRNCLTKFVDKIC